MEVLTQSRNVKNHSTWILSINKTCCIGYRKHPTVTCIHLLLYWNVKKCPESLVFFLNIVLRCLGWGWCTSMVEFLVLMVVLLSTLLYSIFKSSCPSNIPASLTIDHNDFFSLTFWKVDTSWTCGSALTVR